MDREKLLRRVGLKCADFARQLSYHDALARFPEGRKLNFWICMFNNAIDLAVLDWFHLFGYHSDDLHWKNVLADPDAFRSQLLSHLEVDLDAWETYWKEFKEYRDKDVAHIEVRPVSRVPDTDLALKAATLYYKAIKDELNGKPGAKNWPEDLEHYYNKSLQQSVSIAEAACEATVGFTEKVF